MNKQLASWTYILWLKGLLCSLVLLPLCLPAQTYHQEMAVDTSQVEVQSIPDSAIENYQADKDFSYYLKPPEINWWNKFLIYLSKFFLEEGKGGNYFLKIILYALAVFAVIGIIFLAIKVGPSNFLAKSKKFVDGPGLTEEDLQELDFEALIQEAVNQQDFKKGVRLLYLETLKKLTEIEWITWKPDKTNWEYYKELKGKTVQQDFKALTQHYEYVWYGDFAVDHRQFKVIEHIFRHFQHGMEGHRA